MIAIVFRFFLWKELSFLCGCPPRSLLKRQSLAPSGCQHFPVPLIVACHFGVWRAICFEACSVCCLDSYRRSFNFTFRRFPPRSHFQRQFFAQSGSTIISLTLVVFGVPPFFPLFSGTCFTSSFGICFHHVFLGSALLLLFLQSSSVDPRLPLNRSGDGR